jgi:hypothetical protein
VFEFLGGAEVFLFSTPSWVPPSLPAKLCSGLFRYSKVAGSYRFPLSNTRAKKAWICTSTLPYVFMALYLSTNNFNHYITHHSTCSALRSRISTGLAMHVLRNTHARLRDHCCSGKAITITYSECVFYSHSYPACDAHAPYFHLWPFRLYNIFPHYLKTALFSEKSNNNNNYYYYY